MRRVASHRRHCGRRGEEILGPPHALQQRRRVRAAARRRKNGRVQLLEGHYLLLVGLVGRNQELLREQLLDALVVVGIAARRACRHLVRLSVGARPRSWHHRSTRSAAATRRCAISARSVASGADATSSIRRLQLLLGAFARAAAVVAARSVVVVWRRSALVGVSVGRVADALELLEQRVRQRRRRRHLRSACDDAGLRLALQQPRADGDELVARRVSE